MLGTAVGKSNIVRSRHNTGSISSLSSVEVSLGVVIGNSVGVGVRLINMGGLNIRGCGVCRGSRVCRGSVDNRGMVDSMSHCVGNESVVGNWVGNKSVMSNRVGNKSVVSNWVGNKSMVSNWVANKSMVGYWVSNHSVVGKTMMGCAMGDNSTMSMNSLVGRHSRGGGGGSKAKKSGNNESLNIEN